MKDLKCQHHTLGEVAAALVHSECTITDPISRMQVASWLGELYRLREVVCKVREATFIKEDTNSIFYPTLRCPHGYTQNHCPWRCN